MLTAGHHASMNACNKYLYLCAITAGLLPLSATAALPFVQLNQSVLLHIPAKDVPDFKTFIGQTLHEGAPDMARTWTSRTSSRRAPVEVVVTPGTPVMTRAAGQCRLLTAQVSQRNAAESWKVWFCQQADGSWKISGLE